MTTDDLLQIRTALSDLRFIQATALVSSKMSENKEAKSYMKNLHRLSDVIEGTLKGKKE